MDTVRGIEEQLGEELAGAEMRAAVQPELEDRPLQMELTRLAPVTGAQAVVTLPRGTASVVILNSLNAKIYVRFGQRLPAAGDYDFSVPIGPASLVVLPVERYKTLALFVDYGAGSNAADTNLAAIVIGSAIAYSPVVSKAV